MNRNRIVTDTWSSPASMRLYRERWPQEPQLRERAEERGEECGACSFFAPLNGEWGLCCHPRSRHFRETLFERFTCPAYVGECRGSHSFTEVRENHCRCQRDRAAQPDERAALPETTGPEKPAVAKTEANKAVIRRYYEELWNRWDLAVADEIIASDITFRGSLAVTVEGREGFKQYLALVRSAFPDFQNVIEELIAEEDRVVARLTCTGTHEGGFFGIAPTGRKVTYTGVAVFRLAGGRIVDGWVLGDTLSLRQQLKAGG